jgi:hypothetical protein
MLFAVSGVMHCFKKRSGCGKRGTERETNECKEKKRKRRGRERGEGEKRHSNFGGNSASCFKEIAAATNSTIVEELP